jgi:hypothetical protein
MNKIFFLEKLFADCQTTSMPNIEIFRFIAKVKFFLAFFKRFLEQLFGIFTKNSLICSKIPFFMKFRLSFIFGFFIISLYACQSKPEEIILGKWEIDKEAMKEGFQEQITKTAKENPIEAKAMEESVATLSEKIQLSFEFSADGTMIMTSQGNIIKGKWTLNADATTLSTTNAENQKTDAEILELSKNKMILKFGAETYVFTRKP